MVFLGIDLGTSRVKAVLIDDQQKIIYEASSPLTVQRPQPLFSEQNPLDWWKAATKAIHSLEKSIGQIFRQLDCAVKCMELPY